MNRDKVVSLSNRLNEIVEEAKRHPNGNPGHITWDKAVYAIEALSKEANSKPVMPKVFDEWYNDNIFKNDSTYSKFATLNGAITRTIIGSENDLGTWINCDCDVRLYRCIDAIRYGYEVEK